MNVSIIKRDVPATARNGRIYPGEVVSSTPTQNNNSSSAQVQTDWNAVAGMAMILNKPDLSLWYQKTEINRPGIDLTGKDVTLDTVASKVFTPAVNALGAGGYGFKVWDTSGKFTLEIDNLRIRNNLIASELVINRVRASNGSLWISDAAKIKDGMTDNGSNGLLVLEDSPVFVANDIIKAQSFSVYGSYTLVYKVVATGNNAAGDYITVVNLDGSKPTIIDVKGREFVRIGNTASSTRQGALFLTNSESNSPYLEVYDGLTSGTITGSNRKVRMGKLDGITMTDGTVLTGYGLYTNNGWFEGTVKATKLYTSKTGKRIEIDGPNDRLMFYNSAGTDLYYVKIDENIVSSGTPGIEMKSAIGIGVFTSNVMQLGQATGGGVLFDVKSNGALEAYMNGLKIWTGNGGQDTNPDHYKSLRVHYQTGELVLFN